jgi:DNA-binding MarR family transcriptional regulator
MKARGIIESNPTMIAYRMNFLTHTYLASASKFIEAEYGLLFHEWVVLFCLGLEDGLSAKDVTEVTGRPKNTISRAVHKLLELKLIARQAKATDARSQDLSLTHAGQAYYDEIVPRLQKTEQSIYDVLDPQEQAQLIALLGKVIDRRLAGGSE